MWETNSDSSVTKKSVAIGASVSVSVSVKLAWLGIITLPVIITTDQVEGSSYFIEEIGSALLSAYLGR